MCYNNHSSLKSTDIKKYGCEKYRTTKELLQDSSMYENKH